MKGADLKCPKCGGGAVDVAEDLDLDRFLDSVAAVWTSATCEQGHAFCLHTVAREDGVEHTYLPQVFGG